MERTGRMSEFKKYPKIFALGKEDVKDIFTDDDVILIQEKVDGTNMRFFIKDKSIIFGSRTQQLMSNNGEDTNIGKQFKVIIEHIRQRLKGKRLKKFEGYIFFGEGMIKHTMSYDWENIPRFLGFDIMDIETGLFLNWITAEKMFKQINLDTVPLIKTSKAKECRENPFKDSDIPITAYPPLTKPKLQAEGIVYKNYNKQIFAKYVREQFKEENAEAFGGTPKYEETDDGKITARFCTNARIEKFIFKLIHEGDKLELSMMKKLPNLISDDIWEENWREIVKKYEVINPRQIRKIVTKRCLAVLKQVITNTDLEDMSKEIKKCKKCGNLIIPFGTILIDYDSFPCMCDNDANPQRT